MSDLKKVYCSISKSEEQSDGTIIVTGYASVPKMDADGETVTAAAMANALPDYMKFGAVREMHQAKAAGTALNAQTTEDGSTLFTAHVVDTEACKKVRLKVYKGFSIGGKVLERDATDPSIITAIRLVEISLVDRPAQPDSVFLMYKADDMQETTGDHSPAELAAIGALTALVNKGEITPSQIVALATDFLAKSAGEKPELQKSLWDVADLTVLLGSLKSIQSSVAFDAAYEGEVSASSIKLKTLITDLAAIIVELIGEEMGTDTGKAADVADTKTAAATDTNANGEVKDAAAAPKPADDSGEPGKDKIVDKDDGVEEAAGVQSGTDGNDGHNAQIKTSAEEGGDLTKVGDLAKAIGAAVSAAVEPLIKRISFLEEQPAAPKAVLKVVGKGNDVVKGDGSAADEPMPEGLSPEQAAQWEIRKMHRGGGLL